MEKQKEKIPLKQRKKGERGITLINTIKTKKKRRKRNHINCVSYHNHSPINISSSINCNINRTKWNTNKSK